MGVVLQNVARLFSVLRRNSCGQLSSFQSTSRKSAVGASPCFLKPVSAKRSFAQYVKNPK